YWHGNGDERAGSPRPLSLSPPPLSLSPPQLKGISSDILSSLSDCGFLVAAGGENGLTNTLSVSPSSYFVFPANSSIFWPTQDSSSSPKARTSTLLLVTLSSTASGQ